MIINSNCVTKDRLEWTQMTFGQEKVLGVLESMAGSRKFTHPASFFTGTS